MIRIAKVLINFFKNNKLYNFFIKNCFVLYLIFLLSLAILGSYFFFQKNIKEVYVAVNLFICQSKLYSMLMNFSNWNFYVIANQLFLLVAIILSVAFFTLLERKKLSTFQNRKGPNRVGYFGIFQPIADAVKLLLKEILIPRHSTLHLYIVSPLLAFLFGFLSWSVIPFSYKQMLANINLGVLFIFCISIFHIYGIIFAGWASNSRYSFLGALRSSAQLIAYDISLGLIVLNIILYTKSLNLAKIVEFQDYHGWFVFYFFCPFLLFLVCILAETNRHPFDLPEAESELVSGYNVEYSAISFALFFLAEYAAILFISFFTVILFFGGWLGSFFLIKVIIFFYFFLFIRAAIPRYRYDQLMRIGWKYILPIALGLFLVNLGIYLCFTYLY